MPHLHNMSSGRQFFQYDTAILACDLEEWRWQDRDIGNHPVMNVTTERDESGFVEQDRPGWDTAVERQLEALRR